MYLRLFVIALAGLLAYSNTFGMSFNFDDAVNIISNPVINEFNHSAFDEILNSRRAFGLLTFKLNYALSGVNVFWYHVVNLIIHLAASFFLYAMLSLLFRTPYWRSSNAAGVKNLPVPFFAALFFVVHPLQTQAVTYIVQRFTSLATLLYLAAIVFYLKARTAQDPGVRSRFGKICWFAAALVAGFLAFYSKEIAYTLPITIVVIELLFFKSSWSKICKFLGAVLGLFMIALISLSSRNSSLDTFFLRLDEITRIHTISSRSDYLLTQFRVIVAYLRLLFLPVNQSVDYDYVLSHSFLEWHVFGSFLLLLAIFSCSIWLIIISRKGNPYFRLSAFGILWFFLTLSIESSVLPIIDLIFEHRAYLPSAGFFMTTTSMVLWFWWERGIPVFRQRVVLALLLLAVLLAGATWKRNLVWTNEVTLWEDATVKRPNSARAWNNLGGALIKKRDGMGALKALIRSIELDPSKPDALNNIGIAIDLLGAYNDRFNRTSEMFNDPRASENRVVSRWLGDTHNNLGLGYELIGNLTKAEEHYRNAVAFFPALGIAYYNIALVTAAKGNYGATSEQLQILSLVDPLLAERLKSRLGGTVPLK